MISHRPSEKRTFLPTPDSQTCSAKQLPLRAARYTVTVLVTVTQCDEHHAAAQRGLYNKATAAAQALASICAPIHRCLRRNADLRCSPRRACTANSRGCRRVGLFAEDARVLGDHDAITVAQADAILGELATARDCANRVIKATSMPSADTGSSTSTW